MLGIVISEASFMFLLAWGIYHILPLGLELLNFPHLKQKLPKTLNAYYDARKYKQTQARWQRYSIFRMIKISCQFIIGLLLIYFTFFTLLDKHLSEWLSNDYLLIIVFAMAVILIIHLVELPFDYVEFWVLPKKFSSAIILSLFINICSIKLQTPYL